MLNVRYLGNNRYVRICKECESEFEWVRAKGVAGRAPEYCSKDCRAKARRVPAASRLTPLQRSESARRSVAARWQAMSPEDRSQHSAALVNHRYSPQQKAAAAAREAQAATSRSAPCRYCGEPVGRVNQVRCSKTQCRLAFNAERMRTKYSDLVSAQGARRRMAEKETRTELFASVEVYERDNWVCGLCDGEVDQSVKYPDPLSASLDHVVPLSLGGAHTRENTRCSHLVCNMRRGNRSA